MWFKKKTAEEDEIKGSAAGGGAGAAPGSATDSGQPPRASPGLPGTGATTGFIAPELSAIERRFGKLRSALGPGTEVQGRLSFDSAVSLDGVLKGTIRSTELIVVSKLGRVEATSLIAKALVIEGEVAGGEIVVSERLEVMPGGKFIGTVSTPVLVVGDGGVFDGVCKMTSREAAASIAIPPLSPSKTTGEDGKDAGGRARDSKSPSDVKPGALGVTASSGSASAKTNGNLNGTVGKKKISMEELIGK
jgi:cytoskeletal protein CcmA (bactofilin family)